jgi:hypothetical protein
MYRHRRVQYNRHVQTQTCTDTDVYSITDMYRHRHVQTQTCTGCDRIISLSLSKSPKHEVSPYNVTIDINDTFRCASNLYIDKYRCAPFYTYQRYIDECRHRCASIFFDLFPEFQGAFRAKGDETILCSAASHAPPAAGSCVLLISSYRISSHLISSHAPPAAGSCVLTYAQTYIETYIHTYICTDIHTCVLTYAQTYIHTCVLTYAQTYIHVCLHMHRHTYMCAYIHTYIHTCIHAYIHTYMHTCMQAGQFL